MERFLESHTPNTIDQVYLLDRRWLKRYRIAQADQLRSASLQIINGRTVMQVEVVPQQSGFNQDAGNTLTLLCKPRESTATRVWESFNELQLVIVYRFSGSEDWWVTGLDTAWYVEAINWPAMNRNKQPFTALILKTDGNPAHCRLQRGALNALCGELCVVETTDQTVESGAFSTQVQLTGQWLYGTRRVWWGAEACPFQVQEVGGQYAVQVEIPAGIRTEPLPFKLLNQVGFTVTTQTFQRI